MDSLSKEKIYHSKSFYKNIEVVNFVPLEKTTRFCPVYKAGEIVKRRFLFWTIHTKTIEKDLYHTGSGLMNIYDYASYVGLIVINGELYRRARVEIKLNGKWENSSFNSNDEALTYINNLKENCKKVGNELL